MAILTNWENLATHSDHSLLVATDLKCRNKDLLCLDIKKTISSHQFLGVGHY